MKEKVAEIMTRDVITVHENDSVLDVAQVFKANMIAGAPVLNEKEEVVGVISEADILKILDDSHWYTPIFTALYYLHLYGEGEEAHDIEQDIAKARELKAKEIMSRDPQTVLPDTLIDDAAQIMHATGFNRLPVVDETGTLRGIVTRADILASLYEH
jgi:CBS domain-containing protein